MATAYVSSCCRAPIDTDGWGGVLCSRCWAFTVPSQVRRDLIGWLFPAETRARPTGEAVFVRYGGKLEVLRPSAVRGHPDGWFWIDT